MSKELFLLKTSANSSIRGYHFQFLKTLEAWVNSYIDYEEEIFCENEDDFVEKHLGSKIYRFNQIKCYTNEFSLGSDAIKRSLVNFYKIYQSFKRDDYKLEFHLHTNSKPKDGNLLSDWFIKQDCLTNELLASIEENLRPILKAYDEEQMDNEYLIPFIESIKWSFESREPEESISILIDNIKSSLLKIPDSKITQSQTELIFARLYYKVMSTSANSDSKLRRLTHEDLINTISEQEDDWYVKTKGDWASYQPEEYTIGDFIAIRVAAIHSMYTQYLNYDIKFWIKLLQDVAIKETRNQGIKRKAIYEIVVFSLRVLKKMDNRREDILYYLNSIELFVNSEDLDEAVMLLNYINVAKSYEDFEIPVEKDELTHWISKLRIIIDNEIESSNDTTRLCNLYFIKGNFLFFFSNTSNTIANLNESKGNSISWYEKIESKLTLIPLFSVERLLFLLDKQLKFFLEKSLDVKRLEALISKVEDYYINNREKSFGNLQERAINYLKSKNYSIALSIFHRLDRETLHYERLYFNTIIKISIGDCYRIIGLSYASMRYSSLATNQIIENCESKSDLLKLLPKALMLSVNACNIQGDWIFQIFYIRAYFVFSEKFLGYYNASQEEDKNEIFNNLVNIFFVTDRFNLISKSKLSDIFPLGADFHKQVIQGVNESRKIFQKVSKNQLWKQLENQMIAYPFNDFRSDRTITWNALGIDWNVSFEMDYDMLFKVERFVSFFQILLADLSEVDLCLPFNVSVKVKFNYDEGSTITIKQVHKNNLQAWDVLISNKFNEDEEQHFLQLSSTIILELSLLNNSKLLSIIEEDLLERGKLASKLNYNTNLESLKELLITREFFGKVFTNSKVRKPFEFKSNFKSTLNAIKSEGITYNKDFNLTQISNRYNNIIKCNKYTIKHIIRDPRVKIAIKRFKSEGYLDWHILACIFNSKINFLVNELLKQGFSREFCIEEIKRITEIPEKSNEQLIVPIEEFTYEKLKKEMNRYVLATLQSYDLEFKNDSPPYEAIEDFLIQRYNFKTDDVTHPNYWDGEGLDQTET